MSKKKKFLAPIFGTTTFLGWLLYLIFQGVLSFLTGRLFEKLFSKKKKEEENEKKQEDESEIDFDPFDDLELENRKDPFDDLELSEENRE